MVVWWGMCSDDNGNDGDNKSPTKRVRRRGTAPPLGIMARQRNVACKVRELHRERERDGRERPENASGRETI